MKVITSIVKIREKSKQKAKQTIQNKTSKTQWLFIDPSGNWRLLPQNERERQTPRTIAETSLPQREAVETVIHKNI